MSLNELIPELLKLDHDEAVRAIEILQNQIAANVPSKPTEQVRYEVWSPSISLETASILQDLLKEDKEKHR